MFDTQLNTPMPVQQNMIINKNANQSIISHLISIATISSWIVEKLKKKQYTNYSTTLNN